VDSGLLITVLYSELNLDPDISYVDYL